ncbi:DNA pilot protein [Dipodfec virus UOA04_Rod_967]|nr:DNA pilot protein [Dipodfec virus UOA04_Rod_967]
MTFGASSIIGAGISALGGLFSGSTQYKLQHKLLAQQNEYNQRAAELEYKRNLDMWHRQNAYNSPSEQIARLKDADLNPSLMYGNGSSSTGNANGMPEYKANRSEIAHYTGDFGIQQAANSVSNGITTYINTQRQLAEIRATESMTERNRADTDLRVLQSIGQMRKNAKSEVELKYLDDIQRQTLDNLQQQNINMRANAAFVDQRRLQFEAERPLKLQLVEQALKQQRFLNSLSPLTREHLALRISNLAAQYTGRQLENKVTQTLIESGVNLKGGVMERAVNQILNMIDTEDFSWKNFGKALSVGAIGFLTK